ncbi:hypothetical protein A5721_18820 [Mycobacterium vulneris]|nr:hypothetical protein A5721_18820 [Mycolicibacterium vulneris]
MAAGFEVRYHSMIAGTVDPETMFTIQVLTGQPSWADIDLDAAADALAIAYGSAFAELTKRVEAARNAG